jgi:hypothetical protein
MYAFSIQGALTNYFELYTATHEDRPTTGGFHLVFPEEMFCQNQTMTGWIDSNDNGVIDYCDEAIMLGTDQTQYRMHVEDISIDFVVDDGTVADIRCLGPNQVVLRESVLGKSLRASREGTPGSK